MVKLSDKGLCVLLVTVKPCAVGSTDEIKQFPYGDERKVLMGGGDLKGEYYLELFVRRNIA